MHIKTLTLNHFRNYDHLKIQPNPGFNYLFGVNGAGKTNLLEAIFFLIHLQSFRRASRSKIISHDSEGMYLRGEFESTAEGRELCLEAAIEKGVRKYKVNGAEEADLFAYLGRAHAVVFFPESLRFIKEGPALRRAALDRAVASENRPHLADFRDYNRLLLERNQILKQGADFDMIDTWERRLIEIASRIVARRVIYLESLRQPLDTLGQHMEIASALEIKYSAGGVGKGSESWAQILGYGDLANDAKDLEAGAREVLSERILRVAADEKRRGVTLWGPHLDDFEILWGKKKAKETASQGEQRLIMIVLTAAIAENYRQALKDEPIVLFDDLNSELDWQKRDRVLEYLESLKAQVFVTSTEKPSPETQRRGAEFYQVDSGRISVWQPALKETH